LASDTGLRAAPLFAVRLDFPIAVPVLALNVPSPAPMLSLVPLPSVGPLPRAPLPSPAPSPSTTPVPSAAPLASGGPRPAGSPRPRSFLGDGPIVFKGTGTYQLGVNRSSRNGFSDNIDNYSTALSLVAERRTEQTSLSVSNAFGYGGGGAAAGSLIIGYRTPQYGLTYGQVTGPSDSQLEIGGFARGISLDIPERNGDLSFLSSTADQTDGEGYRIYGVRRNWNAFGGFLSASEYLGAGEDGTGREEITDFGFHHFGAALSTDTELAVSSVHSVGDVPDGANVAGAFHADWQSKSLFSSLQLQFSPGGFETLTGALQGGFTGDLAIRKHSGQLGDLDLDLGHSDERIDSDVQHDDHLTLSGTKSWTNFGIQYVTGIDGLHSDGTTSIQRNGALTLTESLHSLSLFETLQSSSVTGGTGAAMQKQLSLGMSRPMFGGTAAYQFSRSTSTGGGSSNGDGVAQTFSYRRSLGRKLDAQLSQTIETSSNNGAPSRLLDTTLSLVRRLSAVVAVQVSGEFFRQTGLGAGKGTAFSASLIGPFGFGEPSSTSGRSNPNLPAVIRGVVTFASASNGLAFNASSARGYNNAIIILDGRVSQRTDSSGEFEFRFVSQGPHTVRLDPASIAPGLIADREYQSVQVMGGQTATVQFAVGNFAGVTGSINATDANGVKHPLGGIGISVDGVQSVMTAPDGHYSIGRLTPGAHTIEIVQSSVPSTVAFLSDTKKTVTVSAGTSTPLDFNATPLGSISGNVMAPTDGGFGSLVGLHNVYVVAEPGEHAVITDDDGSYVMDNMPPGQYTLTVDPDTIPEGLSVLSGPDGPVAVAGGVSVAGIVFKLGAGAKDVVYTFNDGKRVPIQVSTDPSVAPPGALLRIIAQTTAKDVKELAVESDVFGSFPLHLDPLVGRWTGSVVVPALAKGDYAFSVTAHRTDVTDAAALVPVDPRVPLFTVRLSPRDPEAGHTVRVSLKAIASVGEGDSLLFEDGYKVVLPKPTGRVFTFDIRLWRKGLPYGATLVTKRGQQYPLSLR
jgi:hypothetical protein